MNSGNVISFVIRILALGFLTVCVAGCMASAAVTVASQAVKTTAKATGTAARITMDGARAASHTITKPFRKGDEIDAALK